MASIAFLILVLVLRFLKFDDPRPLHNAWTYLIAVPGIMIALSMVLRLVVGRFVERTMQISFLISVAIHLLLMVGAINIVLFANYWPDVFQAITQESTPRKVIVPEYFKPSSASQQVKPDYLRPVQSESTATEKEPNKALRENIDEVEHAELPTDTRLTVETPEPFLQPLPEPTPAQPNVASAAMEIERRELTVEQPKQESPIDVPDELPQVTRPTELQPREDREPTRQVVERMDDPQRTLEAKVDEPARRAEATELASRAAAAPSRMPEVDSRSAAMSRLLQPSTLEFVPRQQVDVPENTEPAAEPNQSTLEARSTAEAARRTDNSSPTTAPSQLAPDDSSRSSMTTVQAKLPERARQLPGQVPAESLPGDVAQAPSRSTVGGATARPIEASVALNGPKSLESTQTSPDAESLAKAIPESRVDRNDGVFRSTTPSSTSSRARSLNQNENATVSQSPNRGELPEGLSASKGSLEGAAQAIDDAGLLGSDGPIQRSRLANAGGNSSSVLEGSAPQAIAVEDGSEEGNATSGSNRIESRVTDIAGRKAGEGVGPTNNRNAPTDFGSASEGNKSGDSLDVRSSSSGRVARNGEADLMEALAKSSEGEFGSSPSRTGREPGTSLASGTEPIADSGAIEVPSSSGDGEGQGDLDDLFGPEPSSMADSRESTRARPDGTRSKGLLSLTDGTDADATAMLVDNLRPGMDRVARDVAVPEIRESDLQTQRFQKRILGGPTLPGAGVPIPAPAFQKRLDRNRDRDEDESLGPLGPEVEETIERGLAFLAAHQREDGSWHLEDFDTRVEIRSHSAATALALLSFQGAGYTHQQGKYASQVTKALEYLIANQKANGDLYIPMDKVSDANGWLYSHGIASLAMCEAYGMTQDERLKPAAQKAVDFMVATQDASGGGWRYLPGTGSDTSVTGWFMMALKSAQLAGLEVPPEVFSNIQRWLDKSQVSTVDSHLYRYNWKAADTPTQRHGRLPTPTMTSVGLLMRLYTGWERNNEPMKEGAKYLLQHPPEHGTASKPLRDTYYWYYTTQVLFHMGGETWREWNGKLQPMLVETQVIEGEYAGSWEPLGDVPDAWGKFGGRLYVTTLNLLSLEVYYRHLPLYEATAK